MTCPFCANEHNQDVMCEPARRVLDALLARGMSFDLPDLEFPTPIPLGDMGPGAVGGDAYMQQFVVQAAVVEVAGVDRAAIVLTGRTPTGPLPRWFYIGTDQEINAAAGLMRRMSDLAIRTAKARRRPR